MEKIKNFAKRIVPILLSFICCLSLLSIPVSASTDYAEGVVVSPSDFVYATYQTSTTQVYTITPSYDSSTGRQYFSLPSTSDSGVLSIFYNCPANWQQGYDLVFFSSISMANTFTIDSAGCSFVDSYLNESDGLFKSGDLRYNVDMSAFPYVISKESEDVVILTKSTSYACVSLSLTHRSGYNYNFFVQSAYDEIIKFGYGNKNSPSFPSYPKLDDTDVDNYLQQEEALNDATAQSQENTVNLFAGFGSFFSNSKLAKSALGVTAVVSQFVQVSWLGDLLNFALVLGAFTFLIGASTLVGPAVISLKSSKGSSKKSSKGGN